MRNIPYITLAFLFFFLLSPNAFAQQESKTTHHFSLGYNIGATAPLSLPNTIRKISSYGLLFTPNIGYEINHQVSNRWGFGGGMNLAIKGMNVTDSVQYFHTIITMADGEFEGDFTGTNQTEVKNTYLTVPIYGIYLAGQWRVKLGGYVAYALSRSFRGSVSDGYIRKGNSLGEKVLIDKATFDFNQQVKKWDWGVHAGAERKIGKRFAAQLNLQMGLEPIFPSSFRGVGYNLRNIYLTAGLSYQINK